MAEISKITLPSGTTYDLKDATARSDIADLQSAMTGGVHLIGETTTALTDQATTTTIKINDVNTTAKNGDLVYYNKKEFLFNGSKWIEMGDLTSLKALAYKDSASASYKPAGTISTPTFTGTEETSTVTISSNSSTGAVEYIPTGTITPAITSNGTVTFSGTATPHGTVAVTTKSTSNKTAAVTAATSGTVTYTPDGDVATTVTLNTATVNSITAVGTLPEFSATVTGETLTLGFSQGTLPTKGANTTVATSVKTATSTFSGTGVRLVTGNIPVPSAYNATFTGTEETIETSGTTDVSVGTGSFEGNPIYITVKHTPHGTVSKPTFTGTSATITVS